MNKQTYTEKLHAYRLLQMLKRDDPCGYCPAARDFDANKPATLWRNGIHTCEICQRLLDLKIKHFTSERCPCNRLREPIRLTFQKLEEKGYL